MGARERETATDKGNCRIEEAEDCEKRQRMEAKLFVIQNVTHYHLIFKRLRQQRTFNKSVRGALKFYVPRLFIEYYF